MSKTAKIITISIMLIAVAVVSFLFAESEATKERGERLVGAGYKVQ